jgi:serine/threonine protein kinase
VVAYQPARPRPELTHDPPGHDSATFPHVTAQVWKGQWSSEVEQAWRAGLGKVQDPRASVRPAQQPREHRTRKLDTKEQERVRTLVPVTAGVRRRTIVMPEDAPPGPESPEILLREEIGAGGMGRVFRARQVSLDREVAIKRLAPKEELPDATAHFESEASITAWLDHPNITPVHDLGTDQDGNAFYSMKLIEGTPWDELLARRRPGQVEATEGEKHDLRAHLEILLEVANAVAFAHSKGVIHRDIKPQNVMVGEYGEVLLVDWGLAVALEPIPHPMRIQDLKQVLITCGTPCYMPPEIATGQRDWIGPWTDVYMLGATLFEVLYGLPPHDDETAIDALKVASRNEWRFPDEIEPDLQPYHDVLNPVVMRALATHPNQRHVDAAVFANEVKEALKHLESAELANEAIHLFKRAEADEVAAQQARKQGTTAAVRSPLERYQDIGRAIAVLEQALHKWPSNLMARNYLVEAHLLHAHSSLTAGDITLAETHLQALETLPADVTPNEEQTRRVDALRHRLQAKLAGKIRRRRWMMGLMISAITLAVILLVGAVVSALLISNARDRVRTERNHLSRLLITTAGNGIEAELLRLFEPVRGSLAAAAGWARSGRLDTDDPAVLTAFFLPLIEGFPVVSGIMRADTEGHEYMLLRQDDGWRVRVSKPGEPYHFERLDARGRVVQTWTEELDYDPRTRPWFRGAIELARQDAFDRVHWTEPYIFYTTKEPGITAAMPADDPHGRRFVLGIDVSLSDISAFTIDMPDSQHGKVFVVSEDDRVIGLPRADGFDSAEARNQAVLRPLVELGEPVSATALAEWNARDRTDDKPFRFLVENQPWWSGFRHFDLGDTRRFWIGVALPESDFVISE